MKILVTGNMGYIGPTVVQQLRRSYPGAKIDGLDLGFFAHCLTNAPVLPECFVDSQHFADVRKIEKEFLKGYDAIVHLAAISNDPMGNTFEEVTLDVNHRATIDIATKGKAAGVKNFVFASSCSIYGFADDTPRTETSSVNPLTAYARSKVQSEKDLQPLADGNFTVTCLRFATACGMSQRLRLDLVLNDFVAGALTAGKITVLSDGTPWRPLINVKDMARAIDWAIQRANHGGAFLAVNAGSNEWNYQVKDLATAVAKAIPGVEVSINTNAPPDKRSYKVNFDLYRKLAPDHQPVMKLESAISELVAGLQGMNFNDKNYRESALIRLKVLKSLQDQGLLTNQLAWAR